MAYLLDANVFIEGKKRYYGLDFCPAFWDWLIAEHGAGRVFSVAKVLQEIEAGGDELATWATGRGDAFFLQPDAGMLPSLGIVSNWVTAQGYEAGAVSAFLQVADYYLTSHAHAYQHIVVTHEVPAQTVRKVKIPNVCIGLTVRYITPFEMLRTERARFVLGPQGVAAAAPAPEIEALSADEQEAEADEMDPDEDDTA